MRYTLLTLLLLPLHCVAQYRPSYTPAPVRPGPTPYQAQVQSQQQAHRTFTTMQAQQTQQAQAWQRQFDAQQLRNRQQLSWQRLLLSQRSPEQVAQDVARQAQAEQQADEELARLLLQQQRRQMEQPAPDAQQAQARQQADASEANQLRINSYQKVFLPGQVTAALQAQALSAQAHQQLNDIAKELLDKAWWSNQEPAQLRESVAAHSNTLAQLTVSLFEFDATPAASASARSAESRFDELLTTEPFDRLAAGQLIREAALADKLAAGD